MKTTHKMLLAATVLGELCIAAPSFAAKPAPVVTLETITIVGHRPAPAVSVVVAAPAVPEVAVARLETIVVVGHRSAIAPALSLAHAQSVPTLPRGSSL